MKKLLLGTVLLAFALTVPMPAKAEISVNIGISLPPLIEFPAPPELIVLPGTYVYVAPDVNEDIYFYGGWWWRPWEGHWYRSRNYGSGWSYYRSVPTFYREIPSGWRDDYRAHSWQGRPWNHQQLPSQQVQRNWKGWKDNRHWEKQQTWGVQGLRPQTRQSRSPQAREVGPQRSTQHGTPDRGQVEQRERKSRSPQQSHELQSQQSRPQAREAKPKRSQQHENPESRENDKHEKK